MLIKKVRCKILFRNNNTFTFSRLLLCFQVAGYIAWENRRHLISQRHHWFLRQIDVCKMCAELPYWYYRNLGSASDWLMQISHAAWPIRNTTQTINSMDTGKNNGFPLLDILGYLKNTHKNPKFGRVRQVPIWELSWEFPGWDLSHFAKFGIFMGIL